MRFVRKAYSMALWTVTIAVVIAAVAMIQTSVKRAVQSKAQATTDYVLWTQWGSSTQQWYKDNNTASIAKSDRDTTVEKIDKLSQDHEICSETASDDRTGFAGVSDGAESLLKTYSLDVD